jgi:hypothetical protein
LPNPALSTKQESLLMSERDPQVTVKIEEIIAFRDEMRARREQLLNSEEGRDPLSLFYIDSLIQAMDALIANVTSAMGQPQDATDQAQYQELLAKTMFKVQPAPLQSLGLPAPPTDGGQKKRE